MSLNSSRSSTPPSSSSTLRSPSTPELKSYPVLEDVYRNPRIPASSIIEYIASRSTSSSTVYIYDLAEQAGFGSLTKSWSESSQSTDATASVIRLQTRAGAGLSLVGRLSEGTSQDTVKGAVLTAYTTPNGLGVMAQSLSYLPPASRTSRLVIQVPAVINIGETFSISPSLAPIAAALPSLPKNVVVFLSATPQESVDMACLSYNLTSSHVIHIFDHHGASREIGHAIEPLASSTTGLALPEAIQLAGYSFFDYFGDKDAHTVILLLNGPLALMAKSLASHAPGLGVVMVRVLRPWDKSHLLAALPSTVKYVHVLDDVPNAGTQGNVYGSVFDSLLDWVKGCAIYSHRIVPSQTRQYLSEPLSFRHFVNSIFPCPVSNSINTPTLKKLVFFGTPKFPCSMLSHTIENTFLRNQGISARLLTDHDVLSAVGKVTVDRILLSTEKDQSSYIPAPILLPFAPHSRGESDFLGIVDYNLLKTHSLIKYAKRGSAVLVVTPWSVDEFAANVSSDVLSLILERDLRISMIDAKDISTTLIGPSSPGNHVMQNVIVYLAFLRLYLGDAATESMVYKVAKIALGDIVQGIDLMKITARAWTRLLKVELVEEDPVGASGQSTLKGFDCNAIVASAEDDDNANSRARIGSWHDAARHLLFPSVFTPPHTFDSSEYPPNPALRPEVPDRTFLVTCTVNRRLTPLEYDRNVFHLEFDSTGTGLTYAIGEALGVHGWNDEGEVLDFCAWYGVDPTRLVTIPIAAGEGKMHTRTVLHALQQQIDLFGRPPKAFYTDLAAYATSPVDKYALQFIGSPEGSSTFKKMAENDTMTFADVLKMYVSARPGIETLCEMVGDVKPRHYSIASAQSVVGNRVDLLVVTVDWVTPSGSTRYGQCTRYLAGLKVGQKVTVSIKPSVMKLPPDDKQPIIMAGLGTGAAPFRAFLQHRAWLAQQGKAIGPIYYYFGSRHQASEYLYGEEIEAYLLDGTITHAGLAFSRDGKKKVYIQHKMLEDAGALVKMLKDENGVFYLCGPTWPVPDVYEALVGALVKFKGEDEVSAGAYLEGLKEDERYVLEVY